MLEKTGEDEKAKRRTKMRNGRTERERRAVTAYGEVEVRWLKGKAGKRKREKAEE